MQLSPNMRLRRKFAQENPQARRCNAPGCYRTFRNSAGLTNHQNAHHPGYVPEPEVPTAPTTHIPIFYSSDDEDVGEDEWWGHWSPENSDAGDENGSTGDENTSAGDENASAGCQRHEAHSSDEPQTSDDEGDRSSSGQGAPAGPSGSRRTTIEEVEDEDAPSRTSSRNSAGKTSRTYHTLLNGVLLSRHRYSITQHPYSYHM